MIYIHTCLLDVNFFFLMIYNQFRSTRNMHRAENLLALSEGPIKELKIDNIEKDKIVSSLYRLEYNVNYLLVMK